MPFPKLNPPEQFSELVKALTLPDDSTVPIRYAGEGNGTKTAAQCLKQEFEMDWAAAGLGNQVPNDETQMFVFRNAVRAVVYMKRNVNLYTYRVLDPAGNNWSWGGLGTLDLCSTTPHPAQSGDQPHGPNMYAAQDLGKLGVWVDNDGSGGQGMNLSFSAAPAATTIMTSYFHDGKSWVKSTVQAGNGALTSFDFTAPAGGAYMYVELFGTAVDVSTVTVTTGGLLGGPFAVWAHNPVSNFAELSAKGLGIRVLGAIGWLRNESSEEFANGKCVASTMAKAYPWSNIASGTAQVVQTTDYWSGEGATGWWGFLTPDDSEDFTMSNDIGISALRSNSGIKVSFPLRERSTYMTCAMAADSTARSISFVSWHHVEYETTSKLAERRYASYSEDVWKGAIEFFKRIPHHYENATHFDTIMGYIGKYGAPISKMLGEILAGIPQTAMIGNALKGETFKRGFEDIEARSYRKKKH